MQDLVLTIRDSRGIRPQAGNLSHVEDGGRVVQGCGATCQVHAAVVHLLVHLQLSHFPSAEKPHPPPAPLVPFATILYIDKMDAKRHKATLLTRLSLGEFGPPQNYRTTKDSMEDEDAIRSHAVHSPVHLCRCALHIWAFRVEHVQEDTRGTTLPHRLGALRLPVAGIHVVLAAISVLPRCLRASKQLP